VILRCKLACMQFTPGSDEDEDASDIEIDLVSSDDNEVVSKTVMVCA
jgi:hypothetical protein